MNDASAEGHLVGEEEIPRGAYSLGEGEAPIRRYLLGDLTPEERQQVEVRLLLDDEFHEQVGVAEDELIDEYLYGDLPEEERRKLGAMLRSGPIQRRKLLLAEDLGAYASGTLAARVEPPPPDPREEKSWWRALLDSLQVRNPAVAFALALALLCALGGGWMFFKARRLEERLARQEASGQTPAQGHEQELQRRLEQQDARVEELSAELQSAREQSGRLNEELAALKAQETPSNVNGTRPAPQAPALASVFLPLTQVRGSGQVPTLDFTRGAARAQLILDLDVVDPALYKSFKAEVYEVDGALIESIGGLSARKGGGGHRVVLNLPAGRLGAVDYRVVLNGLTKSGQQEPIGVYHFRVRSNAPLVNDKKDIPPPLIHPRN